MKGEVSMKKTLLLLVVLALAGCLSGCSKEQPEVSEEIQYVASSERPIFHEPSCQWAEKISDRNLVEYSTREEAIRDGKRPCKVCKP